MKKIELSGKLSFKKETLAKLDNAQMSHVMGGNTAPANSCFPCPTASGATCIIQSCDGHASCAC